jgi:biopolymer transport protein ExbD
MSMSNSNSGTLNSGINITPMIDVLLVLLIIFMVIVPAMPKGEAAQVPQPALQSSGSDAVVLEVLATSNGHAMFRLNQQEIARQDLLARLEAVYANRAQRVLFVKGDDSVSFNQIAEAIDIGHAAGVDRVGLMTPKAQAGL